MIRLRFAWLGGTVLITALFAPFEMMAYEQAFTKTPIGEVQVRTLPAARWLVTEENGRYFGQSDGLFQRLFEYIRANDISMTAPVEGHLDRAEMRFYLGGDAPQRLEETGKVRLVDAPDRRVASLGGKGAYSEGNVNEVRARLESWLKTQTEWSAAGAPYAVFWNGPFTPWFMKRFEVHIPLTR